jgi:hypothetical protein
MKYARYNPTCTNDRQTRKEYNTTRTSPPSCHKPPLHVTRNTLTYNTTPMTTTTQDQTAFPNAISNGGAIAAITVGAILGLMFISLFTWAIII